MSCCGATKSAQLLPFPPRMMQIVLTGPEKSATVQEEPGREADAPAMQAGRLGVGCRSSGRPFASLTFARPVIECFGNRSTTYALPN